MSIIIKEKLKHNWQYDIIMEDHMKSTKKIPVEVYSRVVGYFRPVNQWNKGKQEEFFDRNELYPKDIEKQVLYEYQGNTENIAC